MANGSAAPPALSASGVTVEVDGARLLENVSFQAARGESVGLIGPNGAGKTTLLRALAGLVRLHSGVVTLAGQDIRALNAAQLARLQALVPQVAPYTFGFTSMEVVLMGRYAHMGRFQTESEKDRAVSREALRRMEADAFPDRTATTLSGGERQRVIVARALAQEPRVLLLDEPTANLDVQHQLKVLDIVRDLTKTQGLTAVAALHDLSLAARYCDRLVLLSGGRVLADGAPAAVLTVDNIERAFGVHAVVFPDPFTGAPTVSLLEPSSDGPHGGARGRVHVLCGGGTGARLLYHLRRAGFTVTVGPLGAGDSDRAAADILGIDYVPAPAFSPVDAPALARHAQLVRDADAVVVSDAPFGPGNVRCLDALSAARILVHVGQRTFQERDFTGGEAARILAALPASRCANEEEAVTVLSSLIPTKGPGGQLDVPSPLAGEG